MSDVIINKLSFRNGGNVKILNIIKRIGLCLFAVIVSASLSFPAAVYASSTFDSLVTSTSTITVKNSTDSAVDITGNFTDIMKTSCNSDYAAFMDAVGDANGRWIISTVNDPFFDTTDVRIAWSTNASDTLHWVNDGSFNKLYADVDDGVVIYMPESSSAPVCSTSWSNAAASYIISDDWFATAKIFVSTYPSNYPSGYAGTFLPGDSDGDILSTLQETAQGTSDSIIDTDADGISDYVESEWYPYYNETYCKQTSPFTCADPNPIGKDLFIEIDWMDDGVNSAFKPNATQLGMIETMLDNEGITVHFDLGDYGGGNQLPVYASEINWYETSAILDIHDFKYGGEPLATGLLTTLSPQFSHEYREGVWRYVLYGVEEMTDIEIQFGTNTIGGGAEPAGDDVIIASENSDAFTGHVYSTDRAKAGVLGHEIGHLLCLTGEVAFPEMDEDCEFSGIDSSANSNYMSIMNYQYGLPTVAQLSTINFSDGTNGTGDHDDWSAILNGGMGAFMYSGSYDDPSSFMNSHKNIKDKGTKKNAKIGKNHKKDVDSFITSDAQERNKKDRKVLQASPWLKNK